MDVIKGAMKQYRAVVKEGLRVAVGESVEAAGERRGIFSSAVVMWLMIFQRLHPDHSLAAALNHLRSEEMREMLSSGSLPAQVGRISGSTGGYARARERLDLEVVKATADRISAALGECHGGTGEQRVLVIDGTTIRMSYTEENVEKYPQYRNQHGKAHYPLMRVGIATEVRNGIALRPVYAPYNGKDAVGEIRLAEELFGQIPKGSIVIGDRLFGCCRFATTAHRAGLEAIVRVKEINAKKYIGASPKKSGEVTAVWDSRRSRDSSYSVQGRFIWQTITRKGFRPYRLVLFTTSTLPQKEVVALYQQRWNVELDLRDLKSTLDMDMLYARTPAMNEKELILGVTAYNLIRHLVASSARALNVAPRALSFSRVLKRVHAVSAAVYSHGDCARTQKALDHFLTDLKYFLLPKKNPNKPHEPRKRWPRGENHFMVRSRQEERNALISRKINPLQLQ